jgi:hypothetical protein
MRLMPTGRLVKLVPKSIVTQPPQARRARKENEYSVFLFDK